MDESDGGAGFVCPTIRDGNGSAERNHNANKMFQSCADLGDEFPAALVIGTHPHVWRTGLEDGEEDNSATGGPTQDTEPKRHTHI
jgi:hypothetical protein